jgi:hypothetical protein
MARLAFYIRDKAHTTRIALLARIIQTLLDWQPRLYGQRRTAHVIPHQNHLKQKMAAQVANVKAKGRECYLVWADRAIRREEKCGVCG